MHSAAEVMVAEVIVEAAMAVIIVEVVTATALPATIATVMVGVDITADPIPTALGTTRALTIIRVLTTIPTLGHIITLLLAFALSVSNQKPPSINSGDFFT